MFSRFKLKVILFGLAQLLKFAAWRYPAFAARASHETCDWNQVATA